MNIRQTVFAAVTALFVLAGCGTPGDDSRLPDSEAPGQTLGQISDATVFTLDNGMEVILVQNRANPMVTAFTIVRSGSRNEDAATNGSAHFLEHLLFNGTRKRTQKQLYDEMDYYGGYNNASTGPDFTNYMILMPREYIAEGMDIQADMLFNSTLPPAKFEKERGIVIEEIGKDSDRPGYQVDNEFLRAFFAGTPYARPTLGTVSTISHLSRERVMNFYKTWYVPNNMTLMVIGDFDTGEMVELVREKYGKAAPGPLPEVPVFELQQPKKRTILTSTAIGKFPADRKFLTLGYPLPPPTADGFQALELLTEFLGGDNSSLLQRHFKNQERSHLVNSISAGLSFNRDFSWLKISAELPIDADENLVVTEISGVIEELSRTGVKQEQVRKKLVARAANEIFLQEKLHYYGMMKSGYLAAGGYPFLRDYMSGLQQVRAADIRKSALSHLLPVTPVITLMKPRQADEPEKKSDSPNTYHSEILENGLQVVVQYNPDSPVVGMHLLAKEPARLTGKAGWGSADILQRAMLEGGTHSRPGAAFSEAVEGIGAELKMYDNPWIPYDDYYHSPRYSYIRLKVVGETFSDGVSLLGDIARNAQLSDEQITNARKNVVSLSERAAASTPAVAKKLFYDALLVGNPGFGHELGEPDSLRELPAEAVRELYRKLYAPGNMILTISGNIPPEQAMQAVREAFSGTWGESVKLPAPDVRFGEFGRTVRERVGKQQSYIYIANRFDIAPEDLPALRVLMAIFSDRLAFQLREKQGLAYSIGASSSSLAGLRWYTVRMGTRPQNIDAAVDGIKKEVRAIRAARIAEKEVRKTVNSLLGRHGMRRLDRAGKAYYLAMQVLRGNNADADEKSTELLKRVSARDVNRLKNIVFNHDDHLVVIVE